MYSTSKYACHIISSRKFTVAANRVCQPGGHYWDYYPDALTLSQVTATHFDGVVQEKCNSIANAVELSLSCTNPSI